MKLWLIYLPLVLISIALLPLVIYTATILFLGATSSKIISSGETRAYRLYVPTNYNPQTPSPLVVGIHGFAQWPENQAKVSRWNDLADEHGFIVVYPRGTGFPLRWRISPDTDNGTGPEKEVRFIADLLNKLHDTYNIDPNRIYVNGLSNGGGMTFLLTCELSERIAAAGIVAGAYTYPWEACAPVRHVPAVIFHGTADKIVPYTGGEVRSGAAPLPDIPGWVAELAQRNGCKNASKALPANGEVSGVAYGGCTADVHFYTIAGGGHTWPGGGDLPKFIVGHKTEDIDATRVMWGFFQSHPLPQR